MRERITLEFIIVSNEPLFKEVIIAKVAQFYVEVIELSSQEALIKICELGPDVIIIGERITSSYFEDLLAEARSLQKTRTIVLNPTQNEILLLDSRRGKLRKETSLRE